MERDEILAYLKAMLQERFGIDPATVASMAAEVKAAKDTGLELCLVIGGGNIFRGMAGAAKGMDRATADYMGMLATVINALALQDYLIKAGLKTRVMSPFAIQQVCETYSQYKAVEALENGEAVIIPCGVGYPYFSTDTGMMLRAAELKCDCALAAKNVDGIYDKDPNKYPDAKKYDALTYEEALNKNLKALDAAASAIGMENDIKVLAFALETPENITSAIKGENIGTILSNEKI